MCKKEKGYLPSLLMIAGFVMFCLVAGTIPAAAVIGGPVYILVSLAAGGLLLILIGFNLSIRRSVPNCPICNSGSHR